MALYAIGADGGEISGGVHVDNGEMIPTRLHAVELGLMSVCGLLQQEMKRQMAFMCVMKGIFMCISLQPGARQAGSENGVPVMAWLSSLPRNVHFLWQEWSYGIGGQKTARLFTLQERGQNKYMHHRSKGMCVWAGGDHCSFRSQWENGTKRGLI